MQAWLRDVRCGFLSLVKIPGLSFVAVLALALMQDYFDQRVQPHDVIDRGAARSDAIFMSGDERTERFDGSWITANTFDVLGVRPIMARAFRVGEHIPSGDKVAILASATSRKRYDGALALGISHLLRLILFQVEPREPGVFSEVVVVLMLVD